MDNNTPPEDQNIHQEPQGSAQESMQEQHLNEVEDVDVYEPEQESLGKNKTAMYVIAGVLVVGVSFALYSIFYTPPTPKNLNPLKDSGGAGKVTSDEAPQTDINIDTSALPSPPQITLQAPPPPLETPVYTPPPIVAPPPITPGAVTGTPTSAKGSIVDDSAPPPPPPPAPSIAAIKSSRPSFGGDEASKKRLKTNMIIMDGGGPVDNSKPQPSPGNDPNSQFARAAATTTPTEKVTATIVNNLGMTILQGKIINAVLETAINTDLPGTLRAIVARDTYAESGRDVLIPKGSRLIGTYSTDVKNGQRRVMIIWQRLIRPDGVDILIGSPAVDGLGRAGVKGDVDNKFAEIFSASLLTSAITLGAAVGADALLPAQTNSTTTTTPEGNQITNATPAQQSAAQADLGSHGKDIVNKLINLAPTVTVDQGTLINVFVNKDLTFPSNISNSEFFIQ